MAKVEQPLPHDPAMVNNPPQPGVEQQQPEAPKSPNQTLSLYPDDAPLNGSLKLHSPSSTAPRLPQASQPQLHSYMAPSNFTAPAPQLHGSLKLHSPPTQLHGSLKLHSPSSTVPRLPQASQTQFHGSIAPQLRSSLATKPSPSLAPKSSLSLATKPSSSLAPCTTSKTPL